MVDGSESGRGVFPRAVSPTLPVRLRARRGSPQEVEDIVQESLLRAWHRREEFAGEASRETWVTAIARNKVADFWRARRRTERRDAEAARRCQPQGRSWFR